MKRDANDVAREHGVAALRQAWDGATSLTEDDSSHDRAPAFSDEALALRFADRHRDDLRFVAAWGRWLIWDGSRWAVDETMLAFDLARRVCRGAAAECSRTPSSKSKKIAGVLASSKTVAAVERLAKADRRLAATTEQWDSDRWLLNTPGGAVDLRTGLQRPHRSLDYLTRTTVATPGGQCPTWLAFLDRITAGNVELQRFLQRAAGYALTGSTREHAMFFLYGTGGNGKSVFLDTLSGIFGTYHRTAPIETFTASSVTQHPTDLAGLRGSRLVTATETEEGRRWAEARVKALTGGDKIAARFMRQDFFEFTPQFKLIIAGNHRPTLRSVDEAIRRRLHLIPFSVTIPPEERDQLLGDKLRSEWSGILGWMIEGCVAWQREGLAPPRAVRDATEAYLEAEDAFRAWIDDRCERGTWASSASLFASWKKWAESAGEPVLDHKRFRARMESRGHLHKRESGTGRTGYEGIQLRPQSEPEDPHRTK